MLVDVMETKTSQATVTVRTPCILTTKLDQTSTTVVFSRSTSPTNGNVPSGSAALRAKIIYDKSEKSEQTRASINKSISMICFVCNLPILSHQVCLVWSGDSGVDESSPGISSALNFGNLSALNPLVSHRDSSAQIGSASPPAPVRNRRRRSSLAQLTDILRDWGRSGSSGGLGRRGRDFSRRDTLADFARSLQFGRRGSGFESKTSEPDLPTRCVDKQRRQSIASGSDGNTRGNKFRVELPSLPSLQDVSEMRSGSETENKSNLFISGSQHQRINAATITVSDTDMVLTVARDNRGTVDDSTNSCLSNEETATDSVNLQICTSSATGECEAPNSPISPLPARTKHRVSLPAISPLSPLSRVRPFRGCISPEPTATSHSTTITHGISRRTALSSESVVGGARLQRQRATAAADDDTPTVSFNSVTGVSSGQSGRRGSRPFLLPTATGDDLDLSDRCRRRDSLSPDSAAEELAAARRSLRQHRRHRHGRPACVSPETERRLRMCDSRRQSAESTIAERLRRRRLCSPDGSTGSTGSSHEASPNSTLRRQSTTEEILIAKGFRRQSTTEEMIRCRNFRRQSGQANHQFPSEVHHPGRRDSSVQITDGTLATMTVDCSPEMHDISTQTESPSMFENNHYHEECLKCNSCGLNLSGPNQKRARRHHNTFYCDLHFADLSLMEASDFMNQLRNFKPHSLGCAVARRKSSTTLIFPLPPQACSDELCRDYPHKLVSTPGYWIECAGQVTREDIIWDTDEGVVGGDSPDLESSTDEAHTEFFGKSFQVPTITGPPGQKTPIQEQFEKQGTFELTSIEQETYERYFYGTEHWNYFSQDEDLGPVILSLKQETINGRDQFRIMVRAVSYTVHGLVPTSSVFADRYNREDVVRSLGNEINLVPPLVLSQLPDTPEELLKLDQVFIKSELKVGVIYVREGQSSESEILGNNSNGLLFEEFLSIIGDKCRLKGFDKYKGGLDTVHDLTGTHSVYTHWHGIEIMFHVSTLLPYEENDTQRLQRKRHIGNDIVCVVFVEDGFSPTYFSPACIKSHFLHTFIVVRVNYRINFTPTRYEVTVISRDEVGAFKPYLWEQSVFEKGPMFREWLLTKIVNAERASYSAPKFARMQERTRSQMLEDIVINLQNHAETGQIPKPYRRGSWRPIGHMRPSSPLLDSVRDFFEGYDQLARDFTKSFQTSDETNTLFDITFLVGQGKVKSRMLGVRAIMAVRSRVFQEMLYGFSAGLSPQVSVADILARAVPPLHSPTLQHKPKSSNFLQVPDLEPARPKSVPNSPMVVRAFSRLGHITSAWGRSSSSHASKKKPANDLGRPSSDILKRWTSSQDCTDKNSSSSKSFSGNSHGVAVPHLSVCANDQKVDRTKLCQTEFSVIEFEADTFAVLLEYLHCGSCPVTCTAIPGLICAAEHYDLPELLQACFHHAKQFLRVEVACTMLSKLENYYWRYTSATELVNMILSFVETRVEQVVQCDNFYELSESMLQLMMSRNLDLSELRKFEVMLQWGRHHVRTHSTASKSDARLEFRCAMERLTRDLKLYRIAPHHLIKVVLPSKAIKNERILETLMFQANSGMYRIHASDIEACQRKIGRQDSRFSSEMGSFDNGP